MNRIDSIFAQHRRNGEKALMPFLTAGDPDLATTARLLTAAQTAGASVCELGFAFSDPLADGPVIEASMAHALAQGGGSQRVFEMVANQRANLHIGLVAMVSYSIAYRLGVESFIRQASEAGIDGVIFPDVPLEESASIRDIAAKYGLICSLLIAPTTPLQRAREIAQASSGFVYLLARSGLTGTREQLPSDLSKRVKAVRSVTDLPIAVGFGISMVQHVQNVVAVADAAIVGSAIMRRVAEHRDDGQDMVVDQVGQLVRELAQGCVPKVVER